VFVLIVFIIRYLLSKADFTQKSAAKLTLLIDICNYFCKKLQKKNEKSTFSFILFGHVKKKQ